MDFKNKVVIVTGATGGIGGAIADKFTEQGAYVSIVGRNEIVLDEIVQRCAQKGNTPLKFKLDITKNEDVKTLIDDTINKFGKLDILINNAGVIKQAHILSSNLMEAFDAVMTTNLRAAVYLTHLAAPHLVNSKGNIINISSTLSVTVPFTPEFLSYSISKAGLDHFMRCAAFQLAPKGVRVNNVSPGPVKTDIFAAGGLSVDNNWWNKLNESTALGKICEPEEIADLTLYLAGEKAKSITGANFVIDNGYILKN